MLTRSILVTAVFALASVSGGCHRPSGAIIPFTGGSHTYMSTETRPVTVSLVDLRNDQVVFRMDVPPGKQLTLAFKDGLGDDPVYTPDLMRYQVWGSGTKTGRLRNALTVPAAWSRRIDVDYRDGIEYMSEPPEEQLRTDEVADRPDWWTPEGGEMPSDDPAVTNYDG